MLTAAQDKMATITMMATSADGAKAAEKDKNEGEGLNFMKKPRQKEFPK